MTREELIKNIYSKKSFLCVGIDPDESLIPESISIYDFCISIINVTAPHCIAYKINFAFFEALGLEGWDLLNKVSKFIKDNYPDHFLIADAKRGDIGNTSSKYASGILSNMRFDSITVSPYMGEDSVKPFYIDGKWVIVLMLTSNIGSNNFQKIQVGNNTPLYLEVGRQVSKWGNIEDTMFVVGATHPDELKIVRDNFPDHFFLIPGIGKQGGSLRDVCESSLNSNIGIIVNSSRGIIHSSSGSDYLDRALFEAKKLHQEMIDIIDRLEIK
jgi:orotidine-5'-phosphate decarboxylase